MKNTNIIFKFDVIVSPEKTGLFSRPTEKLYLLTDRLIINVDSKRLEMPYSCISDIKSVRSVTQSENKAHLYWNEGYITFGAISMIDKGTININLTEQVVKIILALKEGKMTPEMVLAMFNDFTPKKLAWRKISAMIKSVLLVLATTGLCFLVGETTGSVLFVAVVFLIGIITVIVLMQEPYKERHGAFGLGLWLKVLYYQKTRNTDKAIEMLTRMAEEYPNHVDVNWILAKLYYQKKSYIKSKEYCQKVLSLKSDHHNAQKLLSQLF